MDQTTLSFSDSKALLFIHPKEVRIRTHYWSEAIPVLHALDVGTAVLGEGVKDVIIEATHRPGPPKVIFSFDEEPGTTPVLKKKSWWRKLFP